MTTEIGYVVVEFNQASGQPELAGTDVETLEEARATKLYYEGVTRKTGRRERYAVATLTLEEDD